MFLFKTLQQRILWRPEDTTLKEHLLHEQQHTFRKGPSTEDAPSRAVKHIEQAIHKSQLALGLFLDIEGAINNFNTQAAVQAMRQHQPLDDIVDWYTKYLRLMK